MCKFAARSLSAMLVALVLFVVAVSAQSVAYRQANLSSSVTTPGFSRAVNPLLVSPAGVAPFLNKSLFVATTSTGRVVSQDSAGLGFGVGAFTVTNIAGNGAGSPFAVVADVNGLFGTLDPTNPLPSTVITATLDGGIYVWGINSDGSFPSNATLAVDRSSEGAVYTGIAILTPSCCAPLLAAANFHRGLIEVFDTHFAPVGTIRDTSLPPGFAPYNLQVIGNQLFVASAMQDDTRQNPVFGPGNGFVSIFDLQGNFVRRFAADLALNAPWGMAEASSNFGPLHNSILIGNAGDGVINAFDLASGGFLGAISDGDGKPISNPGLRGLIFGSPDFGDPDTLYFVAGINGAHDGLFGSITTGLVSTTSVLLPPVLTDTPTPVLVTVAAAPGNSGTPDGNVIIQDNGVPISGLVLGQGQASANITLKGIGTHALLVQYIGNSTFLPSSSRLQVLVSGLPTSVTLLTPSNAAPGEELVLSAAVISADGIPTGDVTFHDGISNLGTAALDGTGLASLRTSFPAAGAHSLTVTYAGDDKFAASVTAPVTLTIGSPDFTLVTSPSNAIVAAGQSANLTLTVTPVGGFTGNVTYSCSQVAGITCTFSPSTVAVSGNAASSTLTVAVAAGVTNLGRSVPFVRDPRLLLLAAVSLLAFSLAAISRRNSALGRSRSALVPAAALIVLFAVSLTGAGCGKIAGSVSTNHGTAQIVVTARSGAISHTSTVFVTLQ